MLVTSFLFVIVVGMVLTVFVECLQYYAVIDDVTTLTQSGQTAAMRIRGELEESDLYCIHIDTSPPGIVFATPRTSDGRFDYDPTSGALRWQRYVCYYVDTVRGISTLVRKEIPIAAVPSSLPTSPPLIPSTRYSAWFRAASLSKNQVCSGVTMIGLSDVPYSGLVSLQLQLDSAPLGSARANSLRIVTSVLPRN